MEIQAVVGSKQELHRVAFALELATRVVDGVEHWSRSRCDSRQSGTRTCCERAAKAAAHLLQFMIADATSATVELILENRTTVVERDGATETDSPNSVD